MSFVPLLERVEVSTMRLVGRDSELHLLQKVLTDTKKGNTNTVLLSGEPGIGKTALLRVFSESIDRRTLCEIRGHYSPRSLETPGTLYSLIAVKINQVLSEAPNEGDSSKNYLIDDLRKLTATSSRCRHEPIDFPSIRRRLVPAARLRPFVIVLDDFHYIDPLSLDLFSYLALGLNDVPICLIAAYRPSEVESASMRSALETIKSRASNLEVRALSTGSVGELLNGTISEEKDGLLEELYGLTGGNPKLLMECQPFITGEGTLSLRDKMSPGISIAISERLHYLSQPDRHLLAYASVIGKTFDRELAIELAGIDRIDALKSLSQLEMRRFIRPSSPGRFEFSPGLLREVLYQEVPPDVRASLHNRIAMKLKGLPESSTEKFQEHIARHLLESREPGA